MGRYIGGAIRAVQTAVCKSRGVGIVVVVVIVVGVVVGVGLVLLVERVVAAMVGRPPLTTHAQLAVLPVLPWARTRSRSVDVALPRRFRRDTSVTDATRRSFGFAHYRTQHPLGGGTTHVPLQVDVVVAGDGGGLPGRFVNAAAFVRFGAAAADDMAVVAGDIVVEQYRRHGGPGLALQAVVVIDTARGLRVEVVDVLGWTGEDRLRRFALAVAARVVVRR